MTDWTDEDTERRPAGCACQWEAGDSPCPHGWQWRPTATDTAFAPPFGTIRECRVCGCLVAGGPTACVRCAGLSEYEPSLPSELGTEHPTSGMLLVRRAADEIERLQARVARLERRYECHPEGGVPGCDCWECLRTRIAEGRRLERERIVAMLDKGIEKHKTRDTQVADYLRNLRHRVLPDEHEEG